MILGLIVGLLRLHWLWLLPVIVAGLAFEAFRHNRAVDWRTKVGLEVTWLDAFDWALVGAWGAIVTTTAYLVGRLLRHWWDGRKKSPPSKTDES